MSEHKSETEALQTIEALLKLPVVKVDRDTFYSRFSRAKTKI